MATTEKEYTNGTGNTYSFDFPYMNAVDVKVEKNGSDLALITTGTPTETEYTLATTEVTLGGTIVTSDKIRIYRSTSDSSLIATFYPGSAIRSGDLNDNFTQNLYSTQENTNDAEEALNNSQEWVSSTNTYKSAISKATDAVNTADSAAADATEALDNSRDSSTPPVSAITIAQNASTTANTADDNADAALLATNALVGRNEGTPSSPTWSTEGDGIAPNPKGLKYAIVTADEADAVAVDARDTYAIPAKQATDALVGTTTDNGATWTVVGGGPDDGEPKGVKYAIDQVETYVHDGTAPQGDGLGGNPQGLKYAIDKAESAAASVAASGIYTIKDDFAALPALTDNILDPTNPSSLLYQISDSTGIESESTVTGVPATYTGDDALSVKLKANVTPGSLAWEWQEYYATDPETRYRKKLIVENLIEIDENYDIGIGNNAHSVGPVTIAWNGTNLVHHASTYVVANASAAGHTVKIPENSTWLIS